MGGLVVPRCVANHEEVRGSLVLLRTICPPVKKGRRRVQPGEACELTVAAGSGLVKPDLTFVYSNQTSLGLLGLDAVHQSPLS